MDTRVHRAVTFLAVVALLSSWAAPLGAQDREGDGRDAAAWLTGGLGRGSEGIAAVAGADLAWDRHIVSFRTATTHPFIDLGGDRFWDAGVLYGRTVRWPEGLAALSTGLGVMGGKRTPRRPSLPVAARMSWHPTSAFGLGAYAFLNFNEEQFFGGVTLTVELGLLR